MTITITHVFVYDLQGTAWYSIKVDEMKRNQIIRYIIPSSTSSLLSIKRITSFFFFPAICNKSHWNELNFIKRRKKKNYPPL
jgi:hypothetical protein